MAIPRRRPGPKPWNKYVPELARFKNGDVVTHEKYGRGTVDKVNLTRNWCGPSMCVTFKKYPDTAFVFHRGNKLKIVGA